MPYSKRQEALLNEYKGNLFEFLVAKEIAVLNNLESTFLSKLTENDFTNYSLYEEYIRNFYPNLLTSIPVFAQKSAKYICSKIAAKKITNIVVQGKQNSSLLNSNDETDILILAEKKEYHLSLKICRFSSFTNTKSAGVKSLFKKYFLASEIQDEFNHYWELEFESFARQMHDLGDIEYTHLFYNWNQKQRAQLPGQLEGDYQKCLYKFYENINSKILELISRIEKNDVNLFKESLLSLMGFSNQKITQVNVFYTNKDGESEFKEIQLHKYAHLKKMIKGHYRVVQNRGSIDIQFEKLVLQIRLKPMNTFTNSSFKINCAVKFS